MTPAAAAPASASVLPTRPRPRLRGVSHQFAAVAALVAGTALVVHAGNARARIACAVYGAALTAMFSTSAAYHRPTWAPAARAVMRRLDHAAIFVLIAGSATPFCLLGMAPAAGTRLLLWMWLGAAAGALKCVLWSNAPRAVNSALYVGLGWFLVPHLGELARSVGTASVALVVTGGGLYTLGAVVYALRRPDPSPTVFGYHEVFHVMVVAAAVCHFAAVLLALR